MKFIGGASCLDFVNTVGGWSRSGAIREDKLETYADLLLWAELAEIIDATQAQRLRRLAMSAKKDAPSVLERARALRKGLHTVLDRVARKQRARPEDLAVLEQELRIARKHERLRPGPSGFAWAWDEQPALDSILWRVSESAAALLTSPDLARLRRCAGANCGWMFLDTSRNHSRQWCDMKDCGNLAKQRRFRERRGSR